MREEKRIRKHECLTFKCIDFETHIFLYVRDVWYWNKLPEEIKPSPSLCLSKQVLVLKWKALFCLWITAICNHIIYVLLGLLTIIFPFRFRVYKSYTFVIKCMIIIKKIIWCSSEWFHSCEDKKINTTEGFCFVSFYLRHHFILLK